MQLDICPDAANRPAADVIIFPFFAGREKGEPAALFPELEREIETLQERGDFVGKKGSTMLVYPAEGKEKRILFVGLGEKKALSMETLRCAYSSAMKRCRGKKWRAVNFVLPEVASMSCALVTRAVAEGVSLSSYVYEEWKSERGKTPFYIERGVVIGADDSKILQKVAAISTGVDLARKLVNGNALDVTPETFAAEANRLAQQFPSIRTTVLNKKDLEREKMGLLLAVGSGSQIDPALVIVEYRGAPDSKDRTMVVGKGITFDTGGINLKPTNFVEDMRADMGGGAAAIGLMQAAASIELKANIVALIPTTENAIDARSYKPGDVYRSYSGKTVEITNTDAEGRLVLADALSYGQKEFSPTRIIDLATLTGAIMIALGDTRAGLFSNDNSLSQLCEQAGEVTGEKVWRMPLDPEYRALMESDIADIRNAGKKRLAGAVTAAIFLQEFIENETPWIHLDIAGTAFLDAPRDYHLSQSSGAGVRLLVELLECLG